MRILWVYIVKESFSVSFTKNNTRIIDKSIPDLRCDGWILKGYSLKVFHKQISHYWAGRAAHGTTFVLLVTWKLISGNYVTIYRKPTHTDQYVYFDSHHPVSHRLSAIRTLNYRAQTAVTDPEERTKELDHTKGALSRCGYRQWAFDFADSQSNTSADKKTRPQSDQPGPSKKNTTFCTLPFVDGLSQNLQRVLKSYCVATSFRPHTTLRKLLVAPKDTFPIDKRSGCVYLLSCQQCTAIYIGQTGRPLGQRIKEHKSSAPSRIPFCSYKTQHWSPSHRRLGQRQDPWQEEQRISPPSKGGHPN